MFRFNLVILCAFWAFQSAAFAAKTLQMQSSAKVLDYGCPDKEIPEMVQVNATPPRIVRLLGEALSANPPASRRVELVRDLGLCKRADALPSIFAAMSDSDSSVRAETAHAVALIGDAEAVRSGLQKLLSDSDPAVRREAVIAAASLKDSSLVTAAIGDSDESVFIAACDHATNAEQNALIAARLPSASALGKSAILRALGRGRDNDNASLVASELNSADLSLKIAAIQALGQMNATSQCNEVKSLLSDGFPSVRRSAVKALSKLAVAEEQIMIARRMLKDPDLSVRQAAAEIFIAHPSADDVPSLFQQLSEDYGPLHDSARDALVSAALASMQSVVESSAKLLSDPDPNRRCDGSYILGRARSDAAFQQHIALLHDQNWTVVRQVAESLGQIGRADAGPPLLELASKVGTTDELSGIDDRLIAVQNAFISCGRLRFKPILPIAQRVMPEKMVYPSQLRASAIWAAGLVGDAKNSQLAAVCLAISNDNSPFESEDARFEAIKAIGNLHYSPALNEMRRQGKESPIPKLRWMAHLVADRLAGGNATPYVPPSIAVVAETSIRDLLR